MASTMHAATKFDRSDVVHVKGKPHLLGTIIRTYYEADEEARTEGLVLCHTSVPKDVLTAFVQTQRPPRGYVFVEFVKLCHGSSLIHEDDLELVDRMFEIGFRVKKNLQSPFAGTVINASMKCSLQPIAYQPVNPQTGDHGPLKFSEKPSGCAVWPSAVDSSDDGPPELHDVPMAELTGHEPFCEDDFIIYRGKVGKVKSVEREAVLLLPVQKVISIHDYNRIETPIFSGEQDIVAMPENPDSIYTYSLVDGRYIWSTKGEPTFPGQYVMTPATNLNENDLEPNTDACAAPEGYILATTGTRYNIDWICPNVFAVGASYWGSGSERLGAATIHEHAVKCDFGQLPEGSLSQEKTVRADTWFESGDLVRFRDPADATQRYPVYRRISSDESFGYDLNLLRIMSTKTEVTVKWQDGSITVEDATSLREFDEVDELWPGTVVALKESIEILYKPPPPKLIPSHLNESEAMVASYRLKKVGIVQTVDGGQRVASVKWYKIPDIELTHKGNMMTTSSSFGILGSDVTDVSIYELVAYSCLNPLIDDKVLIVPDTVHQATLPFYDESMNRASAGLCKMDFIMPSTFSETSLYLGLMKMSIAHTAWFRDSISIDTSPVPSQIDLNHTDFNANASFFGKIISIDTDGLITVRLAAANNCRDVRVSLERLMLVIDSNAMSSEVFPTPDTPAVSHRINSLVNSVHALLEGILSSDNPAIDPSALNEIQQFFSTGSDTEIDGDSNNENLKDGTNAEIEIDGGTHELNDDQFETPVTADIIPPEGPETNEESEDSMDLTKTSLVLGEAATQSSSSAGCPPAFAVLEGPPPSDHHFLTEQVGSPGMIVKRIHKEHRILRSSLPPGIAVRAWESRVDLLRVLIIGPQGTPYEYAPFVIDFHFDNTFPDSPPACFFHSWTNNSGRINPNLYEGGKICLSILGTWPTKNPEESWSAANSTVLQIIVSIMGLVLVKAPFYNEPGFEAFAEGSNELIQSMQYTEKTFLMTRKFIQHALEHPVAGMEDVLTWHYLPASTPQDGDFVRPQLLRKAIEEGLKMIEHHNRTAPSDELDETNVASAFIPRLSLGAVVMLRKHIAALERIESTQCAQTAC